MPLSTMSHRNNRFLRYLAGQHGKHAARIQAQCDLEEKRAIDGLPEECLMHILDALPTRQLFVCMRTSSRWAAATRYLIRHRDSLSLGHRDDDRWESQYDEAFPYDDMIAIGRWNIRENKWLLQSLMTMKLKRLILHRVEDDIAGKLIDRNADRLQVLCFGSDSELASDGAHFPELLHLLSRNFDHNMAKACPKLQTLIMRTNWDEGMHLVDVSLPHVTKFTAFNRSSANIQQIVSFIQKNAATLISVVTNIPLSYEANVVYQKLEKLQCATMTADAPLSCPALKCLTLSYLESTDALWKLPADLTSLDVRIGGDCLIKQAIDGIARLSSLKRLHLIDNRNCWITVEGQRVTRAHLFDNMHQLEEVLIDVTLLNNLFFTGDDGREMVHRLVQNNPRLRSLSLLDMVPTPEIRAMIPHSVQVRWHDPFRTT